MAETTEMQEIILENIDLQAFYGIGNENLARLKEAYPEVKLVARGSSIKAYGDPVALQAVRRLIQSLIAEVQQKGALPTRRVAEIIAQHRYTPPYRRRESGFFWLSPRFHAHPAHSKRQCHRRQNGGPASLSRSDC
jgi:phosphate starvation-inducible protein PhoH